MRRYISSLLLKYVERKGKYSQSKAESQSYTSSSGKTGTVLSRRSICWVALGRYSLHPKLDVMILLIAQEALQVNLTPAEVRAHAAAVRTAIWNACKVTKHDRVSEEVSRIPAAYRTLVLPVGARAAVNGGVLSMRQLIDALIAKGQATSHELTVLRGRLMFADNQIFGRRARQVFATLSKACARKKLINTKDDLLVALLFFRDRVVEGPPRRVHTCTMPLMRPQAQVLEASLTTHKGTLSDGSQNGWGRRLSLHSEQVTKRESSLSWISGAMGVN